ncbi:hypothetical protein HDU76_000892 [Blyttiomyces sp. JEL0837]|nr:hypothetical protein HDU76_000892 [Blyttiomyces sp. JEL0837]
MIETAGATPGLAASTEMIIDVNNVLEDTAWGILKSLNPTIETVYLTESGGAAEPGKDAKDSALEAKRAVMERAGSAYLCGRHKECDIVVASGFISKRHCLIFKETVITDGIAEDNIYIEDFSTNGTYVNGTKVPKGQRSRLKDGDEVQLAQYMPGKDMKKFDDKFWIFKIPQRKKDLGGESFESHYVMLDKLGSGNFATVWVAKNRGTGQSVAVKVIDKKKFVGKPKMVQSIRQEVSILMAVNHPCIINVGGVFDTPASVNIILELAKGGELFDLIIDKKKFTEHEARVIMIQLFTALQYLHERSIVHRDLKPENILLVSRDPDDLRIKISDFGLAKLVGEESFLKTLCGTPNYVAPEVLSPAAGRAYGKPVDLWSCGVILYICLCGFPPFSEELAPPSMSEQIRRGMYSFPMPFWEDVSSEAIDLVEKLIKVDPDERLTAEEALQHPWMKMDLDSQRKDPNLAQLFSSGFAHLAEFKRNDTVYSPQKDAMVLDKDQSATNKASKRNAAKSAEDVSVSPTSRRTTRTQQKGGDKDGETSPAGKRRHDRDESIESDAKKVKMTE